ncbi:hypothetical protein L6452_02649 [Arctium lappa]|uniref:Uncharacterized protein n=1 Tax=Arctium lappa TaxID=4217 RepID=A0ACB9FK57_ARCLA|nr:hypothetical protein L6452_02649 [Arctium lappa]
MVQLTYPLNHNYKQTGQLVALKKTRLEMDEEGIPPMASVRFPSFRCFPIPSTSSAISAFNTSITTVSPCSTLP